MDFLKSLPSTLLYPFRGDGRFIFIIVIVLYFCTWLVGFAPLIGFFASLALISYFAAYFMKIISSTAAEEEELPDLPELMDMKHNVLDPFGRFFFTFLFCFGGPFIYELHQIFSSANELPTSENTFTPLSILCLVWLIIGIIILPMALMRTAIMESISGLNPIGIIKTIMRIPFKYILLLLITYVLVFLGPALSMPVSELNLPTFANFFVLLAVYIFSFYCTCLYLRILGLFYLANEEAFGWVD